MTTEERRKLDASTLNDFQNCHRLSYWKHHRSIVGREQGIARVNGIGWHATMAQYYRGDTLSGCLAAFDKVWEESGVDPDRKRSPQRNAQVFADYLKWAQQNDNFKPLDVEATGAIPVGHILYVVIIDLVAEYPGYGIIPVDHKTTSYLNENWWKSMNPNLQYSGYIRAVAEYFGEQTSALGVNASLVHYTKSEFERRFTVRHPMELAAWEDDVLQIVEHLELCERNNHWPRNDQYCQRWPGGCEYHPLCTTSGIDYRELVPPPDLYMERVWDPLRENR